MLWPARAERLKLGRELRREKKQTQTFASTEQRGNPPKLTGTKVRIDEKRDSAPSLQPEEVTSFIVGEDVLVGIELEMRSRVCERPAIEAFDCVAKILLATKSAATAGKDTMA